MQVIYYEHYVKIIPENHYITDLEESDIMEGVCGNVDPANYKDITDEEAEEIRRRLYPEIYEDENGEGESGDGEEGGEATSC